MGGTVELIPNAPERSGSTAERRDREAVSRPPENFDGGNVQGSPSVLPTVESTASRARLEYLPESPLTMHRNL